jgi:hypothetical protein
MRRNDFLNALTAVAAAVPLGAGAAARAAIVAGIGVPDTALALAATEAARIGNPAVFNHCLRTFYFAELIGQAKRIPHDSELVYVASILHDTGLVPQYMTAAERFEVDGANLSRTIMKQHGASATAADTVWDAIVLHDQSGIARWKAPEVRLVSAGVGADFGGSLDLMTRDQIVAVLDAAPRAGFIDAFLDAVAAVAKRKPFATGACFVTDVAYRRVPGFHLDNFVDEVADDPFKGYERPSTSSG